MGSGESAQTDQAFALQEPVQAGARHLGIDEALGDYPRVIQWPFQQTAQFSDDHLPRGGKRGVQDVRPMRTIFHLLAPPPFEEGALADAVVSPPLALREVGLTQGPDFQACLRRGSRQTVQGITH